MLCSIAPETKDSEFTWKDFQARNNNELADIFGNFINRVLVLSNKYFNGIVPVKRQLEDVDEQVLGEMAVVKDRINAKMEKFKFRESLAEAMNLARLGNKYFADTEPWKLIKTDENRVATVMNIAIQIAANLSIAFEPFLPFSTERLRKMMRIPMIEWSVLGTANIVKDGHQLGTSEVLFPKFDDKEMEAQIKKLKTSEKATSKLPPMKNEIQFDEFMKMDVRVGEIVSAEKHPDADKLLVLKVNTGIDERVIVSGIAEHYLPDQIIGKKVSVLLNLMPRKIRGIESQGMILMAEIDGDLSFISPEKEISVGAEIR